MLITDQQKRNLEYFKNKVCTIITPAINRNFDENILIDYFVGRITKIDEAGVWYEHLQSKCLNFVFYNQLIGIAEEKIISNEDDITKVLNEKPKITLTPQPTAYFAPAPTPTPKKIVSAEQLRRESAAPADLEALKNLLNGS